MAERSEFSSAGRFERPDWYEVCGPETAPPVIFLHGSAVTRFSWLAQKPALQDRYRMILPDLPGHGALGRTPFRLDSAVEMVRELIQRESGPYERVVLVGISLGGYVATMAARRFPKKVAGLVITGASMNFAGPVGLWTKLVGSLMLRMNPEKMRAQAEKSIRAQWPVEVSEPIIAAGLYPRGTFQAFRELPGIDFRAMLAEIDAPVLIINGELDKSNRKGEASFAQAAPNARVAVIPGAGHACCIEQPEQYNSELLRFLESLNW